MAFFSDNFQKLPQEEKAERQGVQRFFEILLQNLPELLRVNLLFILCSIPIVTIPAAMTAMSSITTKMVRQEVFFWREDFFDVFKKSIVKSWGIALPCAGILTAAFYLLPFYRQATEVSPVFYAALAIVAMTVLIVILAGMYALPMLGAVELGLLPIIRNCVILALIRLPQNAAAFLASAGVLLLVIAALPVSLIAVVSYLFSLLSLISSFCAWNGIRKYVLKG